MSFESFSENVCEEARKQADAKAAERAKQIEKFQKSLKAKKKTDQRKREMAAKQK